MLKNHINIKNKAIFAGFIAGILVFIGFWGHVSSNEADPVSRIIGGMTFEQKIGQLIVLFPKEGAIPYKEIKNNSVGGVFINERHVKLDSVGATHESPLQESRATLETVRALHQNVRILQGNAPVVRAGGVEYRIPMFLAGDFEGGDFPALAWGITDVPGMMSLAQTGKCENAYQAGLITGREMRALGFNMNFAPVADVIVPGGKDIFGRRAAGEDPALVGDMAVSFAKGLQDAKVLVIAKHFPGHGNTSANPHWDLPVDNSPLPYLEKGIAPFLALHGRVDGFMAAHVHFNRLQPGSGKLPLSIDGRFLPSLVRRYKLDDVLWVTDELFKMKAVWNGIGANSGENAPSRYFTAAYRALEAGHDLLLFRDQDQLPTVIYAMRRYFKENPEKLNRSLRKILTAKLKTYPDFRSNLISDEEAIKIIGSNKVKAIEIARESIVLIKDDAQVFTEKGKRPDSSHKLIVVAPSNGIYSRNFIDTLRDRGYFVSPYYLPFKEKEWTEQRVKTELDDKKSGNLFDLIKKDLNDPNGRKIYMILAFSRVNEAVFVARLFSGLKVTAPTIFVALGEPYLLPIDELRDKKFAFIAASSRVTGSMEAVADILEGRVEPKPLKYLTISIKGFYNPLQNPWKPCNLNNR